MEFTEAELKLPEGQRLARIIARKDVTRYQVAKDTGIALGSMYRMCSGVQDIGKLNAERLGQYFEMHPSAFQDWATTEAPATDAGGVQND